MSSGSSMEIDSNGDIQKEKFESRSGHDDEIDSQQSGGKPIMIIESLHLKQGGQFVPESSQLTPTDSSASENGEVSDEIRETLKDGLVTLKADGMWTSVTATTKEAEGKGTVIFKPSRNLLTEKQSIEEVKSARVKPKNRVATAALSLSVKEIAKNAIKTKKCQRRGAGAKSPPTTVMRTAVGAPESYHLGSGSCSMKKKRTMETISSRSPQSTRTGKATFFGSNRFKPAKTSVHKYKNRVPQAHHHKIKNFDAGVAAAVAGTKLKPSTLNLSQREDPSATLETGNCEGIESSRVEETAKKQIQFKHLFIKTQRMTDLNKLLGQTQTTIGKFSPADIPKHSNDESEMTSEMTKTGTVAKHLPKKSLGGKPPLTLLHLTDGEDNDLENSGETTGINQSKQLFFSSTNAMNHMKPAFSSTANRVSHANMRFNFSAMNSSTCSKPIHRGIMNRSSTFQENGMETHAQILKSTGTTRLMRQSADSWAGKDDGTASVTTQSAQKRYQMSSNSRMKELKMVRMNLKFVTVNMFSTTLRRIDLSHNKITRLPEEITDIAELEHLKIDHNQIEWLPERLWQLQKLTHLNVSHNKLCGLPESFELLENIEGLHLNDNKLEQLPDQLGNMRNLRSFLIHNNCLTTLPKEFTQLKNLQEFSLEWFSYANPPVSRTVKNDAIIRSFRDDFCQSVCIDGPQYGRQQKPAAASPSSVEPVRGQITFADFLVFYHKIDRRYLLKINDIKFSSHKKRSLVHALCSNQHLHLLKSIIIPCDTIKMCCQIAHQIDLNQVDEKGWTPAMLLVMNLHSIQKDDAGEEKKNEQCKVNEVLKQENLEWQIDERKQNERYLELLECLLSARDKQNKQKVDLNIESHVHGHILHLTVLRHQFQLARKLIDEHMADPNALNANGSSIVHILFANFSQDHVAARALASSFIRYKVNTNLVDRNGLAPLHVAVKKFQIQAIEYAHFLNMKQHDPRLAFNFNNPGKSKTPLHYAIRKGNYPAFLFFLQQQLVNTLAIDDKIRTPRYYALINSAFYRILLRLERLQIFSTIEENSKAYDKFAEKQGLLNQQQKKHARVSSEAFWNGLFFQKTYEQEAPSAFSKTSKAGPDIKRRAQKTIGLYHMQKNHVSEESLTHIDTLGEAIPKTVTSHPKVRSSARSIKAGGDTQKDSCESRSVSPADVNVIEAYMARVDADKKRGLLPPRYMSTKNASANKFLFPVQANKPGSRLGIRENERYSLADKSESPSRGPSRGLLIQQTGQVRPPMHSAKASASFEQTLQKYGFCCIEPIVTKKYEEEGWLVHRSFHLRHFVTPVAETVVPRRPIFNMHPPRIMSEDRTDRDKDRSQFQPKPLKTSESMCAGIGSGIIPSSGVPVETTRFFDFDKSSSTQIDQPANDEQVDIRKSHSGIRRFGDYFQHHGKQKSNADQAMRKQIQKHAQRMPSDVFKHTGIISGLTSSLLDIKHDAIQKELDKKSKLDGPFNQLTEDDDRKSLEDAFQSKKEEQGHVFISNLNINLNLNINISLPPSPKSTTHMNDQNSSRQALPKMAQMMGQKPLAKELRTENCEISKISEERSCDVTLRSSIINPANEPQNFIIGAKKEAEISGADDDENVDSFRCTPCKPSGDARQKVKQKIDNPFMNRATRSKHISLPQAVDLLENTPKEVVNLLAEGEEGTTTIMNNTTQRGEPNTFRMLNNVATYTAHNADQQNMAVMASIQTIDSAAQMITEQDFTHLHKPSPNEFAPFMSKSSNKNYFQGAQQRQVPFSPLLNQLIKGQAFESQFHILVDPTKPAWLACKVLFLDLAPHLSVKSVNEETSPLQQEALQCFQYAAEVLVQQAHNNPAAAYICAEIIHLVSKHNIVKGKNDSLDNILNQLKNINDTSDTFCTPLFVEAANAMKIQEAHRRIELHKFPKVSAKLNTFLKTQNARKDPATGVERQQPRGGPKLQMSGGMMLQQQRKMEDESVFSSVYTVKKATRF